jgi:hypothetical protein
MNIPGFVEVTTQHPISKRECKVSIEISTIDSFSPTADTAHTTLFCGNEIHWEILESYDKFKSLLLTAMSSEEEEIEENE